MFSVQINLIRYVFRIKLTNTNAWKQLTATPRGYRTKNSVYLNKRKNILMSMIVQAQIINLIQLIIINFHIF